MPFERRIKTLYNFKTHGGPLQYKPYIFSARCTCNQKKIFR